MKKASIQWGVGGGEKEREREKEEMEVNAKRDNKDIKFVTDILREKRGYCSKNRRL